MQGGKKVNFIMKKTIKTQFGLSATADFEESTWTFQMPENEKYSVAAGEFAIVDKRLYDQLILSVTDLHIHCQELGMESIYLLNVSKILKKLEGTDL